MKRRVIRIRAEDSPNVRHALAERAAGKEPSGRVLLPGVLTWGEYQHRRATWDKVRQCIGLDAEFWEGADLLLFPPEALNRAQELHQALRGKPRRALALGCDPAEGGDKSTWVWGDELGVLGIKSIKTPDTTVIPATTVQLMREHGIPPERVEFDRGGGGKQAADRLRLMGLEVRTVAFGEPLTPEPRRGLTTFAERKEQREVRYEYLNRRAQMYHEASLLFDEQTETGGYALPSGYEAADELRRQLALMPRLTDSEGRIRMLPKRKQTKGLPQPGDDDDRDTLIGLIGHSPDEADAFVVMVHAMLHKATSRRRAGVAG